MPPPSGSELIGCRVSPPGASFFTTANALSQEEPSHILIAWPPVIRHMAEDEVEARRRRRAAITAAYLEVANGRRVRLSSGVNIPQVLLTELYASGLATPPCVIDVLDLVEHADAAPIEVTQQLRGEPRPCAEQPG